MQNNHKPFDPTSPLDKSSCCQLLFWRWLTPFLYYNYKHRSPSNSPPNPLLLQHIWNVPSDSISSNLSKDFLTRWHATTKNTSKSLCCSSCCNKFWKGAAKITYILASMFWQKWCVAGLCYIGWCICAIVQPEIVAWTAAYLSDDSSVVRISSAFALSLPLLLFASGIGYALFINLKFHFLVRLGIQVKGTLQAVLFDKALKLHVSTSHGGVGSWTNLVSNDTEQIAQALMFLHYLWLRYVFSRVCVL